MTASRDPNEQPSADDDLLRRLLQLLSPGRPRFVLVRSLDESASAALIAALLNRRGGEGRVVLHPSDHPPAPYLTAISSPSTWRIVPANHIPGSIDEAARALCTSETVVVIGSKDAMMRALWLPPSVLEAYAQLPHGSEGVLVVDDWHSLTEEYLGGVPVTNFWEPDSRDLDPVLVSMFEALSDVHFIVVTTQSSPTLESAADAILDVGPRNDGGGTFEVRLVRDSLEVPPGRPYILQLAPNGTLASGQGLRPFEDDRVEEKCSRTRGRDAFPSCWRLPNMHPRTRDGTSCSSQSSDSRAQGPVG